MPDDMEQKLDKILQNQVADRHTFFQLKNFVVGREPTAQGMMWQTIRELSVRKESLQNLKYDLDDIYDQIALKDVEIKELRLVKDTLGESYGEDKKLLREERIVIQTRRKLREKQKLEDTVKILEKRIKYIQEETAYLITAFEKLAETEEFRPLDDVESQKEYWNNKLIEELNLRFMLGASPDIELVKTIMAIDDDAPVKQFMIKYLQGRQQRLVDARDKALVEQQAKQIEKGK